VGPGCINTTSAFRCEILGPLSFLGGKSTIEFLVNVREEKNGRLSDRYQATQAVVSVY
jgi:hypothetical protein